MRPRTNVIILWGGLLILLWAATFLGVRWAIGAHASAAGDARAHGTTLTLRGAEAQRLQRMREGARLMMTIPELRALAGEARGGVPEERLEALTGRLDALGTLVDASCVCVLDSSAAAVAQNSRSPWGSLDELRSFLARSPQAAAMVANVFTAATAATPDQAPPEVWGLWSSGRELYHVVGMPLVSYGVDAGSPSRADGAVFTATLVGDEFARTLSRAAGCEVTFLAGGGVAASSLTAERWPALAKLGDASAGSIEPHEPFEMSLGEGTYRTVLRPVYDPCSRSVVGAMVIQSDTAGAQTLQRIVGAAFMLMLACGLASAAVAARVCRVTLKSGSSPFAGVTPVTSPAMPPLRLETLMSSTPSLPPMDYDALVRRCSGSAAVAERVVDKFAAQLADVGSTLQRNLAAGDAAELARTAHSLKGTAAMTGAESIRGFAESLEALGREGRIDGAEGLIGSLREEIDACLAFIRQRSFSTGAAGATTSTSVSKGAAA